MKLVDLVLKSQLIYFCQKIKHENNLQIHKLSFDIHFSFGHSVQIIFVKQKKICISFLTLTAFGFN